MKIELKHIIPPFKNFEQSQIWNSDLELISDNNYLINAVSGKGKSSLASYLVGERVDFEGVLSFDSVNSKNMTINGWETIRVKKIASVFQDLNLFENLTVFENIKLKNDLTNHLTDDEIRLFIERVGLIKLINNEIGKLSVGQKQRVAIIRALAQPFEFILLDEPFSHLDENNIKIVIELIEERCNIEKASWIITTLGNTYGLLNYKEIKL